MSFLEETLKNYERRLNVAANRFLEDIIGHEAEINEVATIFADEYSRQVYAEEIILHAFLNFMRADAAAWYAGCMPVVVWQQGVQEAVKLQDFAHLATPHTPGAEEAKAACLTGTFIFEQYRYRSICGPEVGDVVIDGGCCLGDTAIWFMRQGAKEVHSFEIDRENLVCARVNAASYGYKEKILIYPYALSDKPGQILYSPMTGNIGGGSVAKQELEGANSYMVECTTLDHFCASSGVRPTFIKMDIEGAEPAALKGAINVLRECRPKLAICIYHQWEHRWIIPLFLADNCPSYRFYLKRSNPYGETVIFGVPDKI